MKLTQQTLSMFLHTGCCPYQNVYSKVLQVVTPHNTTVPALYSFIKKIPLTLVDKMTNGWSNQSL